VLIRLRIDERTRCYVARRTAAGLSRREIIRCLQRYVARELYQALVSLPPSSSSWPLQSLTIGADDDTTRTADLASPVSIVTLSASRNHHRRNDQDQCG